MGNKAQSRLPKSCYRLPTTSLQLIYHANILFKRHVSDFEVMQLQVNPAGDKLILGTLMMTRESTNMSKSVINEGHRVHQIVMMRRDEKVIWQVNLVCSFHQGSEIETSVKMTMV